MRSLISTTILGALLAAMPAAVWGQIYPFYYGHNYGTHYVKDKEHDYWKDYSPDREHYFGDPGYEVYDDPDVTRGTEADSMVRYRGYDYDDDGFGYRYRPLRPLSSSPRHYRGRPDPRDLYGAGVDLFEPDYLPGWPDDDPPRASIAERVEEESPRQPRIRADRSMDKYGRYRL